MTRRIPAEKWHINYRAKMGSFAGFYMPISYSGTISEHLAVRKKAGFFDISHMGEFIVRGIDSASWLNKVTCNDVFNLNPGKAQYSMLLNEEGGVIDDIIVYMFGVDEFLLVVNAGNIDKDYSWLRKHLEGSIKIADVSDEYGLVAISGPHSRAVLSRIFPSEHLPSSSFHFRKSTFNKYEIIISATGYTGEKETYEILLPSQATESFLDAVYNAGKNIEVIPCGLGARDTLRVEACLPLYGNELKDDRTPFESDLGWVVKLKKQSDFIGKKALLTESARNPEKKIGYFILNTNGPIPRTGYRVFDEKENEIGEVTSGAYSPLLKKPVFMAFLKTEYAKPGSKIYVNIRNEKFEAVSVEKPFTKYFSEEE